MWHGLSYMCWDTPKLTKALDVPLAALYVFERLTYLSPSPCCAASYTASYWTVLSFTVLALLHCNLVYSTSQNMMMSSNGNNFCISGPL